jgi:hypothetical protein
MGYSFDQTPPAVTPWGVRSVEEKAASGLVVEQAGNVQIAAGQWGRTPSVRIMIPPNDLSIASIPETNSSEYFDSIANAPFTREIGRPFST